jgi:hypothetical protein
VAELETKSTNATPRPQKELKPTKVAMISEQMVIAVS